MAYNNSIPLPTDWISASQPQIKDNFTALDTFFAVNHITYSAGSDNGEHTKVTFHDVSLDPIYSPAPGNLAYPKSVLYTKHTGVTPNQTTQLYFSNQHEAPATHAISHVSGLLAWAKINIALLTIINGFNVASVAVDFFGYIITFTSPLPNNNYAINICCAASGTGWVQTQLAASFTVRIPAGANVIYVSVIGQ
jgi:hypothetical protein